MFSLFVLLVFCVWLFRHGLQRYKAITNIDHKVVFRARANHTKAWYFYILYLLSFLALVHSFLSGNVSNSNVALVIFLIGLLLGLSGLISLNENYTEELEIRANFQYVSVGAFSFTKHPMRWGLCLEVLGFSIASSSKESYFLLIIFVLLTLIRNSDENKMISEYHKGSINSL